MTKITYNGKTTELADGNIATLPCKDKKMETDVKIEAPEGSGVSIAEWNGSIAYNPDAIVIFEKIYYVCIKATTAGSVVNNPSATPSEWKRLNGAYKGEYNSSTTYYLGDIVLSNNNLYQSKIDNPETTPDNDMASRWTLLHEGGSGDGAELNIAYGDTAPEDTSKLWVKTTQPSAVKVSSEINLVPNDNNTMLYISASLKKLYTSFAQVGSKTYVFGGSSNGYSNEIEVFDTSTETVRKLSATMPSVRASHKSVAIGTKIYIIGGNSGGGTTVENTIYCFDTETQICTTLSTKLPYGLGYMGAASYGSKIYLFGGLNASNQRLNTILCFDTETDTITALGTTMTMALLSTCAITVGSSIYLFSGSNGMSFQKYVWKFDCINQSIEEISVQIPSDWTGMWNGCVVGSQIVLTNGNSKAIALFNFKNEVLVTTTLAVATKPSDVSMASAGNTCYLLSGADGKGYKIVLGLTHILLADTLLIHSNLNTNIFNLINTDTIQAEIGVSKVYKGNADGIGEQVEASLHNGTSWVTI